jgi:hypothetical protein
VLYVVGALLELAGIALLAWDVFDAGHRLKEMSQPDWRSANPSEKNLSLFALMAKVAAGNITRRAVGVGFFAAGLIVQTIANVASL